ncbi:hypothetical protein KXX12_007782 [Aspergillus fumigatus]|nr:hypothetical protein KXX12_007782 [Aspergillus fumigatus]
MPLPLKREMDDYYVFCKVEVVKGQVRILRDQPMSAGTLNAQLRSFSEIHGSLNALLSHQFRYGSGKMLDERWVSDAQRNLIMKHASSTTFLNHYRPRRHVSMQEHMLGLPPDKEFERAVTSISRWIDKWRPRYLNDMEKASVERDPELQAAIQRREDLADEYEHSQDPTLIPLLRERQQDVTNTRRRLQYKRRKEVRQEFSRKQAVIDIERQLPGSAVHDEDDREFSQAEYEMPPAQIRLVEKLLVVPTSWSLEAEWQRRHEAVEAIKEYCDFLEGGPLRGRPKRSVPRDGEITRASNQNETKEHIQTAQKPLACFQCYKTSSQHQGVQRHFRTAHLGDCKCNFCDMELLHQMHLQNHAAAVHHLRT